MKKIIRLTESDLTRIVKRVINENKNDYKDTDRLLWNIIKGFDSSKPKDFTELLSDISDLIEDSKNVNDFEIKYKKFTKHNQKDINNLTDNEKNKLDSFINSIITRYDFK
jgi:hypothetical protein